jgi:Flp pilus assembly protein TadG
MLGQIRTYLRDRKAAVAPLFAVGLIILVGIGGLAWDVSRAFALRAELEAAVDAATLAGATQLDGQAGARARAITAAQGALVQNSQYLARAAETGNVTVTNTNIVFLVDLTTRAVSTTDANANFIEINLTPRSLGVVTGALIRAADFNVTAHAVGGYGSALCMVPPMFICNPDETQTINLFGAHAGKGITMNGVGGGSAFAPGNFGFMQVTGNLSALQQAMGRSPPSIECFGEQAETRTGDPTSVLDWFNTRFDIFANNTLLALRNSPNYAPSLNTVTGLNKNDGGSDSICKPATAGTVYNGNGSAVGIQTMPLPRDACAYPPGGSTCTGGANAIGNGVWDRDAYFRIIHGYVGPLAVTPFTSEEWSDFYDYPGVSPKPTYPTRYQVYLWELANMSENLLWANSQNDAANSKTTQAGDWARPQCSTATPIVGVPDRRTISALVLNCSQIQNNRPSNIIGAVDIFLTEPARVNGNGMILGEIISSTSDSSAVGQQTRLHSVRLFE